MEHRLILKTKQEVMQSQPIQIRRGIFQGDSLLPLLFCIALIPLTNELNRADCGYQVHGTERKISLIIIVIVIAVTIIIAYTVLLYSLLDRVVRAYVVLLVHRKEVLCGDV